MSTSATTIDSNDPRLTQKLIPSEPEFDNPIATALFNADYPARASRVEHCGEYKSQKCEDGHVTRRHRFCGTRTCTGENCAQRLANAMAERLRIDADHAILRMEQGGWARRFTFIDLRFSCDIERTAIQTQVTKVIDKFLELGFVTRMEVESRVPQHLALWAYAAGLDDSGLLVIRVLAFEDFQIGMEEFKGIFEAVSADVHVVPLRSIHRFLPLLFAVSIPKSDSLRAAMEITFIGIRRLRTVGMFDHAEMDELSVEEGDGKPSTNNSELADTQESIEVDENGKIIRPHKIKSCPICNKRIVSESGWMPKHLPPPLPERTTFYPCTS